MSLFPTDLIESPNTIQTLGYSYEDTASEPRLGQSPHHQLTIMKIIRNILVASILFVCIQAQSQTLEEFRKTPIENSSHSDAVELEFPVLPEVPYEIFGSPDLKTWETLEAGITDENPKVRR